MPYVDVGSVKVNFPFEPYDCQLDYMHKLITCLKEGYNGILESPTGTGKTLCLLCACLAWLEDKKAQVSSQRWKMAAGDQDPHGLDTYKQELANQIDAAAGSWSGELSPPKIIYASRTHSQLSQAIQELKRTAYSHFRVCVLGSREQLCIHPQVVKEENNSAKVHLCRAKVNARSCFFYNNVENSKAKFTGQVMDIEDLVNLGKKENCCPYYSARELKAEADIIFLPYNYLLDPKSRKAHGVELQGNIVIFDEAHNLEKMCEESASFDLTSADIAAAIRELNTVSEKIQEWNKADLEGGDMPEDSQAVSQDFTLEQILMIKAILMTLEEQIDMVSISRSEGVTKNGNFIFELLEKANLSFQTKNTVTEILDKVVTYLTSEATSMLSSRGSGLSKFADVIKIVFSREPDEFANLNSHKESVSKHYKVHVQENKPSAKGWANKKAEGWGSAAPSAKVGRTLSYWCFSPGHAMENLQHHGVRSIILTSGTLSPMSSFKTEMGIEFKIELENPHVIEKHQVWIGTVGKGPDGTMLSSAYNNRFREDYMSSLGNAIVNFARVVPNGLLLFFASYPVMEKSLDHWRVTNIWTRIEQYKPIFVEPKYKGEFLTAMSSFYTKINDPTLNGAIFAAVCRGKVSEGLDFSDINGRAVVITGLPFPPRMDPKVVLKMQYLDESRCKGNPQGLTGQQWYRQQASRAVNQAIGRVIRHRQDYGAIILCDNRFNGSESKAQLPSWVRPAVVSYDKFGLAMKEMMVFFKTAEKMLPPVVPKQKRTLNTGTGCQGAYFAPNFTRVGQARLGQLQKASVMEHHVPSLAPRAEETSLARLKIQYDQAGPSQVTKTQPRNLLDALTSTETKAASDDDDDWNPFRATPHGTLSKDPAESQAPKKKKILLKKSSSTSITHKKLETAEQYLKEVKKTLSSETYKVFTKALTDYKKTGEFDPMVACMADIFTDNSQKHHLFQSFYRFVRPHHKQQFDQTCRNLTGRDCGYKPSDAVTKKRPADVSRPIEKKRKVEDLNSKFDVNTLNTKSTGKSTTVSSLSSAAQASSINCNEIKTSSRLSALNTEKENPANKIISGSLQSCEPSKLQKVCDIVSTSSSEPNQITKYTSKSMGHTVMTLNKTCQQTEDTSQCQKLAHTEVLSNGTSVGNSPDKSNTAISKDSLDSEPACSETKDESSGSNGKCQESVERETQKENKVSNGALLDCSAEESIVEVTSYQQHKKTGYRCSRCQQEAVVPLKAVCSHVCCMECWKLAIRDARQCPECKITVKRKHLSRILYPSGSDLI